MLAAALTALLLTAAPVTPGRMVRVRVLERLHPQEVELLGPQRHRLVASGATLLVDGRPVEQPLRLAQGAWSVSVPGGPPRRYQGAWSVSTAGGELALVVTLPLERYVSEVVASETLPGTPGEALRAQAVVVRSFVLAQGPRHADADLCDLAHCQLLRGRGVPADHRQRSWDATRATSGRVLVLASGAVAETPYHAACGGHTADPAEVFQSSATGAAAVADAGCPAETWEARVSGAAFRRALAPLLGRLGPTLELELEPAALELVTGEGGYVVRVVSPSTGRAASGDAVARALDRTMGWGRVRGGRFTLAPEGDGVRVTGSGLGHGLGLCQAGAARRAALGESYRDILRHYFPLATLRSSSPQRFALPPQEAEGGRTPGRATLLSPG